MNRQIESIMKRFLIIIATLVATATLATAQPEAHSFSIIPRLGVTIAKITGDNVYPSGSGTDFANASSPKYKPGLMAGFDLEYQITNKLAASVGAYYSRQGEKYDDLTESHDHSTKAWKEVRDWKQHHDYINVPLTAIVYVAHNLAFRTGVQLGFNTSAKSEYTVASFSRNTSGEASTESVEKIKSDVDVKKFDVAIPIGISYEYMNVILDARYNIGLTRVYDELEGRNSVFSFNVGYRFKL